MNHKDDYVQYYREELLELENLVGGNDVNTFYM